MIIVSGLLFNSGSSSLGGYGTAIFKQIGSNQAQIIFCVKIATAGTAGKFSYGLNRDLLKNKDSAIPTITPSNGGILLYFDSSGAYSGNNGYAGIAIASGQFWAPARIFTTNNDAGIWSEEAFPVNSVIAGIVYGKI